MGRLTLNVLLSFAQFEREVTAERIRDKVAASKRKGLWVGGMVPLGYELKDGKLAIVAEEAERVRMIFTRYLALGSVNRLVLELRERNVRTKVRKLSTAARAAACSSRKAPSSTSCAIASTSARFSIKVRSALALSRRARARAVCGRAEAIDRATIASRHYADQERRSAEGDPVRCCRRPHGRDPCDQAGPAISILRVATLSARACHATDRSDCSPSCAGT